MPGYRWAMLDGDQFRAWGLGHKVLVVEDVELAGFFGTDSRPDGIADERGFSFLRELVDTFVAGKRKGKRPLLLREHNDNASAADVIGRILTMRFEAPWVRGHVMIVEPQAIAEFKDGLLPERSPEVYTESPASLTALSLIKGQEGHFSEELREFVPVEKEGLSKKALVELREAYPQTTAAAELRALGEVSDQKVLDALVGTSSKCVQLAGCNVVHCLEPTMPSTKADAPDLVAALKTATQEDRAKLLSALTDGAITMTPKAKKNAAPGARLSLVTAKLQTNPSDEDVAESETLSLADLVARMNEMRTELDTFKSTQAKLVEMLRVPAGGVVSDPNDSAQVETAPAETTTPEKAAAAAVARIAKLEAQYADEKSARWMDAQVAKLRAARCIHTEAEIRKQLGAKQTDEGREEAVARLMLERADTDTLPDDPVAASAKAALEREYDDLVALKKHAGEEVKYTREEFVEHFGNKPKSIF